MRYLLDFLTGPALEQPPAVDLNPSSVDTRSHRLSCLVFCPGDGIPTLDAGGSAYTSLHLASLILHHLVYARPIKLRRVPRSPLSGFPKWETPASPLTSSSLRWRRMRLILSRPQVSPRLTGWKIKAESLSDLLSAMLPMSERLSKRGFCSSRCLGISPSTYLAWLTQERVTPQISSTHSRQNSISLIFSAGKFKPSHDSDFLRVSPDA